MDAAEQKLKLYVTGVGVHSGNPEEWKNYGYVLVLAHSPAEALEIADDLAHGPVYEVKCDESAMLAYLPSLS